MDLKWNVYCCNANRNEIEVFNIFDHIRFKEDVLENLKKYKEKERFAMSLKLDLFYYFGDKYEWEAVISSWPPYITNDEIDKILNERSTHNTKYGKDSRFFNVDLITGLKIDVCTQVMNNFDIFLNYVWNSKVYRPRKKYMHWVFDGGFWKCSDCKCENHNLGTTNKVDPYLKRGSKFCPSCGLQAKK